MSHQQELLLLLFAAVCCCKMTATRTEFATFLRTPTTGFLLESLRYHITSWSFCCFCGNEIGFDQQQQQWSLLPLNNNKFFFLGKPHRWNEWRQQSCLRSEVVLRLLRGWGCQHFKQTKSCSFGLSNYSAVCCHLDCKKGELLGFFPKVLYRTLFFSHISFW